MWREPGTPASRPSGPTRHHGPMTSRRDLHCPAGCPDGRFEVLNAAVVVDRAGRYLEHDAGAATYVCVSCRSVAVDLAAAAREMRAAHSADTGPLLTCPRCSAQMLPPEDDPLAPQVECPLCGEHFAVEEGMRSLHGGVPLDGDGAF